MSKIKNYGLDSLLTGTDKLIGSDSDSSGTTKNYSINSISNYIYTDLDIGSIENKLAGIESGAQVNTVDSVNTQTGDVVLDADDIDDAATANKFTTQSDIDRLANTSGTNTGDQDLSNYVDLTTNQTIGGLKTFTQDITINGGIYADNLLGTSGQILSSTGTGIEWIDSAGGGAGLEGTQYIYVQADGTDVENATELQNAYDTAKTMSPSATNRITIVAGIGNYNFGTSIFEMDTQFIDLVSLDGNRSVIFNHTLNTSNRLEGSIRITANDVFVKGIDVLTKSFTIGNDLNLLKVENCKGGNISFGGSGSTVSGTFINCQGGDDSFGDGGLASGTFTNCQGGDNSFGGVFFGSGGTASGTFTNCQGGDNSFGGDGGTASGEFIDCVGNSNSFGGFGTASGTFIDCVGNSNSFGGSGSTSGIFTNCQGGFNSFGAFGTTSGTFTNCIGNSNSFGGGTIGAALGTFTNCQGENQSFGGNNGQASGTFTNCIGGSNSFSGFGGTASGTFTNCQGGDDSFGGTGGILEGKLYYCRLTDGTFETVSGGGVTVLCIDGNNQINSQN